MGELMRLHTLGMSYRHEKGFFIERPEGSGDNLLVIFKTGARLIIDGENTFAPPDSAILFRRRTAQFYGSDGGEYANHWLHMDCLEESDFHKRNRLPFDTIIKLENAAVCEELMARLSLEMLSSDDMVDASVDMLIRLLLIKIGENCRVSCETGLIKNNPHSGALRLLRAEMYSNSAAQITVEKLAKRLSLSPSHFQAIYKEQFGVSCYEDLLRARLSTAEYYLGTTNLSVKEIAALCGYENGEHFMRQFKSRTGLTPTEYRHSAEKHSKSTNFHDFTQKTLA